MRIYEVQSYGDSRFFLKKENAEIALKEVMEDDKEHWKMLTDRGMVPVKPAAFEIETED